MEIVVVVKPLISVIVTSYNYLHFIATAIDSARNQTYPNIEIVVVDNCSTDGSVPALRARYASDPRVKIFQNERNLGEIRNSNRGFEHTTGEYVLWLSADDWMLPRHLERLVDVFEKNPGLDVVYSGAFFANEAGRVNAIRSLAGQYPADYVDARDELIEMVTTTCPLCWSAALFRRDLFLAVGLALPDGPLAADWEAQIRIALHERRFGYLKDPSTVIRLHANQQTGDQYHVSGKNVTDFLEILELYVDHPAMQRVRGREGGIANHLEMLATTVRGAAAGDPFTPEVRERLGAMLQRLRAKASAYEPARVRESTISVILPASGPPQLFLRALESVAAQTFARWQVVVVDSGHVPVGELLRDHPAWDRVSYVRFPSALLPGHARNLAIRLARGAYIAHLNEDDVYLPDHLESLVRTIEETGAELVAAPSRLVVERADWAFTAFERLGEANVFRSATDVEARNAPVANGLPLSALMYYRRSIDRAGTFNETLPILEDFEYLARLERHAPLTFARETTVEVSARIGLQNVLGRHLQQYLPVLDAVYAAYPVAEPGLVQRRDAHRRTVERFIANAAAMAADPAGLIEFVAALSGKNAVLAGAR